MTTDILKNIMLYSDNPGRMGEYLTRQIRELVGARVVILLESTSETTDSKQRVIDVQPARYKKLAVSSEVKSLAAYCHSNPQPSVWRIGDSPAEVEGILSSLGYQTSITIPLLIGTDCVGVLLALDLLDVFAIDKVIQVLKPLSGVAALILRNALLYETQEAVIEERTHQLSIRNQITSVFLTIPDSEMYAEVLNVILAATESKSGIFGYIDPDGALVCPSLTRDVWEQCRISAKDIVFPREKWGGIWGRALVEKKSLYSNESFRVPEGHIPLTRALDVPIIHQGEVIGNILVGNKEKDYTDKDAGLLETIANHIAPILMARLQRGISENERQQADEKVRQQLDELERSRLALLGILEDARRSEEALKKSEAKYMDLYENAPDMYASIDAKTAKIMQCNSTLCKNLGFSKKEIIGRPTFELYHPNCMEDVKRTFETFVKTGEVRDKELQLSRKDGSKLEVSLNVSAVRDEDGKIVHSRSTWRDNTEPKKVEEILHQYEHIVSSSTDMMALLDNQYKYLAANKSYLAAFNLIPEQLIGNTAAKVFGEDFFKTIIKPNADRCLGGEEVNYQDWFDFPTYGSRYMDITYYSYYSDENKIMGFVVNGRNITDRKQAADALEEKERYYRSILYSIHDDIIVIDPEYRIVDINNTLLANTGFKREDAIGKHCFEISHGYNVPCDQMGEDCTLKKVFETGEKGHCTHDHQHMTGTKVHVDILFSPMKDTEGKVTCVIESVRDITDIIKVQELLKGSENRLIKYRNHLEQLVKDRTEELEAFSYSVSHDLRAPLRAISGFSEILSADYEDKLDEEANRLITIIKKNTQDMNQLITDLLNFSHLGRQQIKTSELNMKILARDVFEELSQQYPKRDIKFKLGEIPSATGDRNLIRLVITNLISNAIKFTEHRKIADIEVGFKKKNKRAFYYVKDNGAGFDMKYADKLFGVFQRLHNKEEFEGTGVGLAIVQKIIHKHGGKVYAEGEVDNGATFYFSLPKNI